MSENPSRKDAQPGRFQLALKALWGLIRHNGLLKIVSLVLAVILWAMLITQDPTLTREKIMSDGAVTVVGSDSIRRNGYVVTEGLEKLGTVTIRADVPQGQYQSATAASYNPRIDLSRINASGEQDVRINTTNSTSYGTVLEVTPATVRVKVEDYITRYRIPVTVESNGELPEGWYATQATRDPPVLAVSGPRSLVSRIVRAEAMLTLDNLPAQEGSVRTAVPYRLIDGSGAVIDDKSLTVTSESVLIDSIVLEQTMIPQKTLNLSSLGLVTGTPANGYEIKGVTITPETVVAAGASEVLTQLDTLYTDAAVDVTDLDASVNRQIRIRKPSELTYLSQDSVTVAVEIGPVFSSRIFHGVRIELTGVPDGMTGSLSLRAADVDLEGELLQLVELRLGDVHLYVDAEGLGEGTHELPVHCEVSKDGSEWKATVSPATVYVTIRQK